MERLRTYRIASAAVLAIFLAVCPTAWGKIKLAWDPLGLTSDKGDREVKWYSDLTAAHRAALAANRPMLLVFSASWCVPCKRMDKEALHDPVLARYINASFIPVHLDVDRDQRVAKILEITSVPTTVVLSPNADLLGRIPEYRGKAPYQKSLQIALDKGKSLNVAHQAGYQTQR